MLSAEARSGCAMSKSASGTDRPTACSSRQRTPAVSRSNPGTRTLYLPAWSTCRKGFSRSTGTFATTVNGGFGHSPTGGLVTPTKTMFQLEPVHFPHCVFREIHCCCVPEFTSPSTIVSDIHPPLAHPRSWFRRMPPCTCMRRNATACDTAHCIVPPAGSTAKFSAERQKVVVALLLLAAASTCTLPVIVTSSGIAPNPETWV